MDFIERIVGISPDGGSGALEMLLLMLPGVALLAFGVWRRVRHAMSHPPPGGTRIGAVMGGAARN